MVSIETCSMLDLLHRYIRIRIVVYVPVPFTFMYCVLLVLGRRASSATKRVYGRHRE